MNLREKLASLSVLYEGNRNAIQRAIRSGEEIPYRFCKDPYITILDEHYPMSLRELEDPPYVLFYKGNLELLNKPKAVVIGSRTMSDYGRYMTDVVVDALRDRYVIVSGMAKGVDGEAHRRALSGGKTIGVIGSGLGTKYPAENRDLYEEMGKDHLILSEFPHDVPIRKYNFPCRNRILAALGEAVIVTQASGRSGTMITVNSALQLGKEIFCVPYPFMDPSGIGCNRTIQEGAHILFERRQLEELSPKRIKESS